MLFCLWTLWVLQLGRRRSGKLRSFLSSAIAPDTFLREVPLAIVVSSSALHLVKAPGVLLANRMRFLEMLALARHLGKAGDAMLGKGLSFAHCHGPAEAIAALQEYGIAAGDAILVKGSNSVGLGRLVQHFTQGAG